MLIDRQTNKETELFKKFNNASVEAALWLTHQRQRGQAQFLDTPSGDSDPIRDPTFVDTLLDIGEETNLLAETKDIRDELNMISMVLKHQVSVIDDLKHALLEEAKGPQNQQQQSEINKRFREQHKVIDVHLKDVERMDKQADSIYTSVRHLELHQMDIMLIVAAHPPPRPQAKTCERIRSPVRKRSSCFHG